MIAVAKVSKANLQSRLKRQFFDEMVGQLQSELGLPNKHQVPQLEKIVLNVGLGRAQDDKKLLETAANTLRKISGQQPVATAAKKSIAGFKLRQGSQIGLKVTLRGDRMYEFADRFINLVLPRLRDFHGISGQSFDGQGNYTIGLTDQSSFPELTYEDTATAHGLQVIFSIHCFKPEHSRALLEKLGLPFERTDGQDNNRENQ